MWRFLGLKYISLIRSIRNIWNLIYLKISQKIHIKFGSYLLYSHKHEYTYSQLKPISFVTWLIPEHLGHLVLISLTKWHAGFHCNFVTDVHVKQ